MNENGAVIMSVNFEVISRGKVRFASISTLNHFELVLTCIWRPR